MTIEQPKIIDFVALDKGNESASLIIVDHLVWDENEGEHLLLLQDKLNDYLQYIEGGQLYNDFPKAVGRKIEIRVLGQHPLSKEAEKFFDLARGKIGEAGFHLKFEILRVDESLPRAIAVR
jgi:hypothetical protein